MRLLQEIRVTFEWGDSYHTVYVWGKSGLYTVGAITRRPTTAHYHNPTYHETIQSAVRAAWNEAYTAAEVLPRAEAPRTVYLRTAREMWRTRATHEDIDRLVAIRDITPEIGVEAHRRRDDIHG